MNNANAMIELVDVAKDFGATRAIEALTLKIPAGEIYALLGPNGAGKTTTIRMLLGFIAADRGIVRVGGFSVGEHCDAGRAQLAYIPEQVNLYPNLSALENLDYFARLAGRRLPHRELTGLLLDAGLQQDALARRLETYSKGMRQKVGIAIALAKQARALLLDEPSSGLDPAAANALNELLRGIAQRGVAVLMATHDLFRAHQIADRIGLLDRGRLVAERSGGELQLAELESLYLASIGRAAA